MTGPQDPFATPDDQPPPYGAQPPRQPGPGQQPPAQPGYGQQPPAYGEQPPAPPGYGAPAYGSPAYGTPPQGPPRNGMGTAALVLGILSLFTWFFLIGGLLGLVAVVLGFIALGRVKRGEANNRGMALTGIITGGLGLLLTFLVVAGVAALFNSGEFGSLTECLQEAGDDRAAIDQCSREFEDRVR